MTKRPISIIIPANNEKLVIGDCLRKLLEPSEKIAPEIIVVCNGCTDDTTRIVRGFGDDVRCVETETASKVKALNLGDAAASYFPRFYLDADVKIGIGDVWKVVSEMERRNALAAAPQMKMDLSGSSRLVRCYYDVWCNLPYCRAGMIGAGVYALSEKGRNFFGEFPNIIADDRYVRALFRETERVGVSGATSIISAPTNLKGLIKIKTRSRLGGYEFESRFPELLDNETKAYGAALFETLGEFNLWHKALVYLGINLLTRIRARRQIKTMGFKHWERDDSSREKSLHRFSGANEKRV